MPSKEKPKLHIPVGGQAQTMSGPSASLAIASHSQYPVPLGSVAASGSGSHLAKPNGSFRQGERDVLRYVATRKSGIHFSLK